jgi:hypothetical protein
MKSFLAPTENFIKSEKSELTEAATSGSNVTLKLKSNQGFADKDYVIVKKEGNEEAHICQINATVEGNTDIQVATLKHNLSKGDQVVKILFNQRKFYGSLTKTGDYTELTDDGSPKDIEVDNPDGTLFEYTGSDGYLYFKATYYNSETLTETDTDDAVAVLGGESDRYCSINDIREEAGFNDNSYINDGQIEIFRQTAESEVKSSIYKLYSLPLSTIPDIIKGVVRLLAAGQLLYKEYGAEADGTSKDGIEKIKEARSILKEIRNGSIILLDDSDEKLEASGADSSLEGIPNETTDDDIKFKISDNF